jgi:hypothetical protein
VPGYEILGILGRGGMGVVYQAWQIQLNRIVALKMVLAGAQAGLEEVARFRIEAEAVARLQHPHIVAIHEVGEHAGRPYFAMEYVDGEALARQLNGTPLPFRRAAQLTETLARAMYYAHTRGVIHRDLTPANVLVMADGTPKITDFGLAKLVVGGGPTLTQSGAILGTPSYMAPEQATGKSKAIGAACDVYALGAILYELLTGRPPFKAETPLETLQQVQSQEPVSPSRLQPKTPRDLETITLKCLAKEPARRYSTAGALADDLECWLEGRPIQGRRVGVVERGWRWCRRNPKLAGALGAATLFLVSGTLVSSLLAVHAHGEAGRADREAAGARAAKRLSDQRHYASEMKLASLDWEAGRTSLVQQRLQRQGPQAADAPDLRGFEWHYLQRLGQLELRTLQGHTESVWAVAFSKDGSRLASAGKDGTLTRLRFPWASPARLRGQGWDCAAVGFRHRPGNPHVIRTSGPGLGRGVQPRRQTGLRKSGPDCAAVGRRDGAPTSNAPRTHGRGPGRGVQPGRQATGLRQ